MTPASSSGAAVNDGADTTLVHHDQAEKNTAPDETTGSVEVLPLAPVSGVTPGPDETSPDVRAVLLDLGRLLQVPTAQIEEAIEMGNLAEVEERLAVVELLVSMARTTRQAALPRASGRTARPGSEVASSPIPHHSIWSAASPITLRSVP